jgi:hypothetical protein
MAPTGQLPIKPQWRNVRSAAFGAPIFAGLNPNDDCDEAILWRKCRRSACSKCPFCSSSVKSGRELKNVTTVFPRFKRAHSALSWPLKATNREDFDFFSSTGFDPSRLQARLPFFRDLDAAETGVWVHRKRDNLEAFLDRRGPVKVAFFGGLDTLQRVEDPRLAAGSRVRVASLLDLAGMNMRVIQMRGSWKDYVDIHALACHRDRLVHRFGSGQAD